MANELNYKPYREHIIQAITTLSKKNILPKKKDIAAEVAKLKEAEDPLGKAKYTAKQVRPSISRVVDKLCQEFDPPILCYKKKYYLPNDPPHLYAKLSEEYIEYLRDKIVVNSRVVHLISYNMCVIHVSSNPNYIPPEGKFETDDAQIIAMQHIADCIDNAWVDIWGEGSLQFVLVKYSSGTGIVPNENSHEFAIIKALEDALVRLYDETHPSSHRSLRKLVD
jgi:hypothetical protein